jgi:hypothetical protein
MRTALRLFIISLFFSLPAYGQAPSSLSNFSVSGSAVGFSGAGGTQAAALVGGWFQTTQRVSVGYLNLAVPAISANYNFGMGQYSLPLSSLLGKTISGKLLFDASAIGVSFQAGLGKVLQTTTPIGATSSVNTSRFAEIFGGQVNLPMTSSLSFNVIQVYWVHGGIAGTSGGIISPAVSNFPTIAMGLNLAVAPKALHGADFKHLLVKHGKATVRLGHCEQC